MFLLIYIILNYIKINIKKYKNKYKIYIKIKNKIIINFIKKINFYNVKIYNVLQNEIIKKSHIRVIKCPEDLKK